MRYLNLYKAYFITNWKSLCIYSKDFIFGILAMIFKNLVNLLSIFFIYNLVDKIKGYTYIEIILIYAISTCGFGLRRSLAINTISLPYYIRTGNLDNFMTKPISVLFQIMCDEFDEDAWGDLLLGIILIFYASYNLNLGLGSILYFILASIGGGFIFAGISILGSTVAFKTVGQVDFANLVYSLYDFSKYPTKIFPKLLAFILSFIIPVGFVAYVPVSISLYDSISIWRILLSIIIPIIFFYTSCILWNKSLKKYNSSGS